MSNGRPWSDPAHPMHRPAGGGKARGSWPPFAPGNRAAERHGATPRVFSPGIAAEVALEVLGPDLCARYGAAANLFGELWERCRRALAYLDQHGMVTDEGKASPLLGYLGRWESTLLKLLIQFGQTPTGEAQLRKLVAEVEATTADLDGLREKGRALRLAALERPVEVLLPEGESDEAAQASEGEPA